MSFVAPSVDISELLTGLVALPLGMFMVWRFRRVGDWIGWWTWEWWFYMRSMGLPAPEGDVTSSRMVALFGGFLYSLFGVWQLIAAFT